MKIKSELEWPEKRKRIPFSKQAYNGDFISENRHEVISKIFNTIKEIRGDGSDIELTSNVRVDKSTSNMDLSDAPYDTACALWFQFQGESRCLCCDMYKRVDDNLYAIWLALVLYTKQKKLDVELVIDFPKYERKEKEGTGGQSYGGRGHGKKNHIRMKFGDNFFYDTYKIFEESDNAFNDFFSANFGRQNTGFNYQKNNFNQAKQTKPIPEIYITLELTDVVTDRVKLREQFHKLSQKYHPDSKVEWATPDQEKYSKITQAYKQACKLAK